MSVLAASLADLCRKELLREKLLVMPSLMGGYQLMEGAAGGGAPWVNLSPVTPLELAARVSKPELLRRGWASISAGQILFLLEEVLAQMEQRGVLRYFALLSGAERLGAILYGPIMELRLAGVTAGQLDSAFFVDPQKGREIQVMLAGYEAGLAERKWADAAAVYEAALTVLEGGGGLMEGALFVIPEMLELEPLSFRFLDQLSQGRREVLPGDPLYHLPRPPGFYFTKEAAPAAVSPLSWLYRVEEAPAGVREETQIFRAYGAANEVREILRRVKQENIPLDRVLACYTKGATYIPLFYSTAKALDLPVTFGEGVPLSFTRPGRAALKLLRWVEENYSATLLYRVLNSGDLQIERAGALARLLRQASVGWSRERYPGCLDSLIHSLAAELESARVDEAADEGLIAARLARCDLAVQLNGFTSALLMQIPAPDESGAVDFSRLCRGLQNLVLSYARVGDEMDAAAREAVLDELEQSAQSCPGLLPEREALQRLRLRLERISAGAAAPRPGYLHVAGYCSAETVQRPYTYVVGLEAGTFPGGGLQDPVLLDRERELISPDLALLFRRPEQNLYCMASFLASRRGRLTLSYPCYDVVEGRAAFPAAVLLQTYRLQGGGSDADYSKMLDSLDPPAAYLPEQISASLTPGEWWLFAALGAPALQTDAAAVSACFPWIESGRQAFDARMGPAFSVYDGKITVNPQAVDPRLNHRLSVSASQLENLSKCPFAYFLRYLLRIRPPEEYEFDPGAWLEPLTRGSLLHEVYCLYLREYFDPLRAGSPPGKERLMQIAGELIDETRQRIPPPSEIVFEADRSELLRSLEVFWRVEIGRRDENVTHAYLEVPFGLGEAKVQSAGLGLAKPVVLAMPGDRVLRLWGKIDRLDRVDGGGYRVWDYKTGSTYGYKDYEFVKQGRQLQHALYSLAAEALLKQEEGASPDLSVEAAGYLFPTEKGEGIQLLRSQESRERIYRVLEIILDLMAAGVFNPTDELERCGFCDYPAVCRSPEVVEWIKIKLAHSDNDAALGLWKELQEYV